MESVRPSSQLKFFAETAVSRRRRRQKMQPAARHKYSKNESWCQIHYCWRSVSLDVPGSSSGYQGNHALITLLRGPFRIEFCYGDGNA